MAKGQHTLDSLAAAVRGHSTFSLVPISPAPVSNSGHVRPIYALFTRPLSFSFSQRAMQNHSYPFLNRERGAMWHR